MITLPASNAVWVVEPVKQFDRTKSRLDSVLAPEARRDLAVAMLSDVLYALCGTTGLKGVVVATADVEAAVVAQAQGFEAIGDQEGAGINAAVSNGLANVNSRRGAVLETRDDIPLVTTRELGDAIDEVEPTPVVIAPAARKGGTNLLTLARADLFVPAFERYPAAHHAANARVSGTQPAFFPLVGTTRDIDTLKGFVDLRGIGPECTRVHLACSPITFPARQVERAAQ
jgi:2-phospho-L-lactate guanylyltransferase